MELPPEQSWVFEMVNNILIEVLGTIAEQERETIRKRQAEGIAAAKAKGKHLGRPKINFPEDWSKVYKEWKRGNIKAVEAMDMLGLKKSSFYKLVRLSKERR